MQSVEAMSNNVSMSGLGLIVPVTLTTGTRVKARLQGVSICGYAQVRHSQSIPAGYRLGLQFELSLLLQDIPDVDFLLAPWLGQTHASETQVPATVVRWMEAAAKDFEK